MIKGLDLNSDEKRTFVLHLSYSFIEGILMGALILNEFVFLISMKGSNYQFGILFQFTTIVFLLSIFCNELLERTYNKKKLLRIVGAVTRFPLLLIIFFPANISEISGQSKYHYMFLAIFLLYYLATPIIFPTINLFLKNKYRHENFGKLYSYAGTVNKVVTLIATFLFGLMLYNNNYVFIYVYPVLAVLGFISIFLLSGIEYKEINFEPVKRGFLDSIKKSVKSMLDIIRNNKPYRDFEIGFMFYGFSYMITYTVITIYFVKALDLNYFSISFYKNSYNILVILLLPYCGKLLGNTDPRKYAVITFTALFFYLLFVSLTEFFPSMSDIYGIQAYYMLIIATVFYGIFAATMILLWSIGSAYFCKNEQAGHYQSVHLSLVGLRGLFAPLLGIFFYELAGFIWTFTLGMILLLISVILMLISYKRYK